MGETDTRTAAEKATALVDAKAAEAQRVQDARTSLVDQGLDPDELVWIGHPQITVPGGPVPRHAVITTWGPKGWSETEAPTG